MNEEQKFKPTLNKPANQQSQRFENNFNRTMNGVGVKLNEVDGLLTEKEQSLKKKIFSLAKMEALVFSDPKLSAVYEEMADNGEEKYGYHYNETIQNMIFNDYVLNSPKYLQKYKMAIPKEKKRRDKSGINQLKKAGEEKMTQSGLPKQTKTDVKEGEEQLTKVMFLVNENDPENPDVFAYFPEIKHQGIYRTAYSHVGQHSAIHPDYANESRQATPEEYQDLKTELEGQGYNLEIINKDSISETTSAGGSAAVATGIAGGSNTSSTGQYSTPAAWGSGDLMKTKGKSNIMRKPIWKGGTIIQESQYLTDPSGFEKYVNELSQQDDIDFIQKHSEAYGSLDKMNPDNLNIIKTDIQKGNLDEPNLDVSEYNDLKNEGKFGDNLGVTKGMDWEANLWNVLEDNYGMSNDDVIKLLDSQTSFVEKCYKEGKSPNDTAKELYNIYQSITEVAKSKAQQRLFGMAHAAQKGDIPMNKLGGAAKKIAKTVSVKDVEDFASTKHEDLPEKVDENEDLIEFDIPEWALSALINGDKSGLEDEDITKLNNFINQVVATYGNAIFMLGDIDGEDNLGFKHKNDIDNLGSNVYRLYIKPRKQNEDIEKINENDNEYVVGKFYDNKGIYKGVVKGNHVFQRHDADKTFKEYGKKYHIEKIKNQNTNINELHQDALISSEVVDIQPRAGEKPFMMQDGKYQYETATYKDGRKDIVVYSFNDDVYYDYEKWRKFMGINETDQSMIDTNPQSMANKSQPVGDLGGNVPMGTQQTGGMNEEEFIPHGSYTVSNTGGYEIMLNDAGDAARIRDAFGSDNPQTSDWLEIEYIPTEDGDSEPVIDPNGYNIPLNQVMKLQEQKNNNDMTLLEELNKELKAFSVHHNKLVKMNEDRKISAEVNRQRVIDQNPTNFKKDLQHSGTKEIINVEKELQWKDQQTDVKDPQKLGLDIEKQEIKSTDAEGDEHLKNVGDSANDKGDEIPKRNRSDEEQEEVELYTKGLHSTKFDIEPSERFKDRMKADMGDKIYAQRQKQLEDGEEQPLYNKESVPTYKGEEMNQFNKYRDVNESMITGRYIDALGKRRLIDFMVSEVKINEDVENLFELDFTGLGNTYNSKTVNNKVSVNEGVVQIMESHKFFTDGKNVYAVKKPVENLNENVDKKQSIVNEQHEKMKHLLGYKPQDFVDTKNVKKNRGF